MATSLLRLPQVQERTGLSRSEIYRRMSLGEFPQKVALGVRAVGWDSDEIDAYIARVIKDSRAKTASAPLKQQEDKAVPASPSMRDA